MTPCAWVVVIQMSTKMDELEVHIVGTLIAQMVNISPKLDPVVRDRTVAYCQSYAPCVTAI